VEFSAATDTIGESVDTQLKPVSRLVTLVKLGGALGS
jgi:hypothetical protein